MKPIRMDEKTEEKILKSFFEKFQKEWQNFKENMNDKKFTFSATIAETIKEKIVIRYTPLAYLKMQTLVDFYDTEVGWYGLVDKVDDKLYLVSDVRLCKQYVSGGKVDTEDEDTLEFFNSLSDEEAEHLHFQAHSHVNFSTEASGPDLDNQRDVVQNMGKSGFYIFQIWNKKGDINTYLYDLDANMFYDKKDIELEVEGVDDWVVGTKDLVKSKPVAYYPNQYTKPKENKGTSYLPGYWDGISYNEGRWDW